MKRRIVPYNPKLIPLARKLRNNSTLSEVLLWRQLKKGQMLGYDFDRQRPIGNYIVDFYCTELQLVLEIDGCSHNGKGDYDLRRQQEIEEMCITILHFDDKDVKQDLDAVLKFLRWNILQIDNQEL